MSIIEWQKTLGSVCITVLHCFPARTRTQTGWNRARKISFHVEYFCRKLPIIQFPVIFFLCPIIVACQFLTNKVLLLAGPKKKMLSCAWKYKKVTGHCMELKSISYSSYPSVCVVCPKEHRWVVVSLLPGFSADCQMCHLPQYAWVRQNQGARLFHARSKGAQVQTSSIQFW